MQVLFIGFLLKNFPTPIPLLKNLLNLTLFRTYSDEGGRRVERVESLVKWALRRVTKRDGEIKSRSALCLTQWNKTELEWSCTREYRAIFWV